MSNRNFDNRVIVQRLQNQNYARNLYKNNVNGKQLILKIEDRFYLLSQNIFVLPLTPIVDSKLINTIQSTYLSEIDKQ